MNPNKAKRNKQQHSQSIQLLLNFTKTMLAFINVSIIANAIKWVIINILLVCLLTVRL